MNTAAEENDVADAIDLKKAEFDLCETEEATSWLSIATAQQHGNLAALGSLRSAHCVEPASATRCGVWRVARGGPHIERRTPT
jgi:hypothetical protein